MWYEGLDTRRTYCQTTVVAEDGAVAKDGKHPYTKEAGGIGVAVITTVIP